MFSCPRKNVQLLLSLAICQQSQLTRISVSVKQIAKLMENYTLFKVKLSYKIKIVNSRAKRATFKKDSFKDFIEKTCFFTVFLP